MPRRRSPSALAMVLAASCWLRALSLAAQARTVHLEPIDFSASTMQFSGAISNDRLPDLALLRNATNNRIANRCLQGASRHTLEAGGAAAPRLAGLVAAHIVRFASDGTCRLAFPVLVGVTRDTVVRLVQEAVPRLDSIVERIAARLAGAVGSRQGIVFHLLWSRVMDASWERAWTAAFPDHELPSVSWVVYPAHRFAVGTNYAHGPKGGDLAITWSPRFASHLAVFQGASYELYRAAWGAAVADSEVAWRLREFGALDSSAHSEVFSYKRGERLDSILTELTGEYAAVASRAYDWAALARRLDLDRGDLFVILLHETAYALFDRLHQKGRLTVPEALWGGDGVVARELASLALEGPPGPADDALAAYMKNGWRGECGSGPWIQGGAGTRSGEHRAHVGSGTVALRRGAVRGSDWHFRAAGHGDRGR